MNPALQNLNTTQVRQVQYSASLQTNVTTINFTVYNCSASAFIQQIILQLAGSQPGLGANMNVSILNRGNGYPGVINGKLPLTFTTIGTSDVISPGASASASQVITQNGNVIIIDVLQSVQDCENVGCIYIQMNAVNGYVFNTNFTMDVVFRPEITFNTKFDDLNVISPIKPYRILSGPGSYNNNVLATIMVDQTVMTSGRVYDRNNPDVVSYGFGVGSTNPYFYFGNNSANKRWFINFAADNQPNVGIVTFSYFNGAGFVPFLSTQVSSGCLGPGSYNFAYGGVVIFTPPTPWYGVQMVNDPWVQYNAIQIGLGTLASSYNLLRGTAMNWIQCQVGFVGLGSIVVSTVVPLLDPQYNYANRRPLV